MNFSLANIEIDFINYNGTKDFQILAEYLNETTANIIIKRLDTLNLEEGWTMDDNLQIFICNKKGNTYQFTSPISLTSSILIFPLITTTLPNEFYPFEPSTIKISSLLLENYQPLQTHYINNISLDEFNNKFNNKQYRKIIYN